MYNLVCCTAEIKQHCKSTILQLKKENIYREKDKTNMVK